MSLRVRLKAFAQAGKQYCRGAELMDRGAPTVDGPCRCDCGREFVNVDARRQHTLRMHAEPVKGLIPRLSGGAMESGFALPVMAAAIAATSVRRRR